MISHYQTNETACIETKETLLLSNQIIRLESIDNYTRIFSVGCRPIVLCKVLKDFEEILQPFGFVRVHRSHLVNKQHVKAIHDAMITMEDASIIGISRRKKVKVMRELRKQSHTI